MKFAVAAAAGTTSSQTLAGHLEAADWVYLPAYVADGVCRLEVSYTYDKPAQPVGAVANSCDIGVFDEHGIEINSSGWPPTRMS